MWWGLIDGAGRSGILSATGFAWIDVATVTPALRERYVREGFLKDFVVSIYAIAY